MAKQTTVSENLKFYEALRKVPNEALKKINGGRLSGMSDINPVWRMRVMTEVFGPCGIGWKYEITKQWQEQYGQEIKSFTNINLYIKVGGEWSEPIPGTGGATLVEANSRGLYVSDEGHKMSLTDALSVAMKALGVAADIYFEKGKNLEYDTKYSQQAYIANNEPTTQSKATPAPASSISGAPANADLEKTLEVAFKLIKSEIETAPSKKALSELHAHNEALHGFPAYREAMNKRYKEVA